MYGIRNGLSNSATKLALLVSTFQGPNEFFIKIDANSTWPKFDGMVTIPKPLLEAANWKVVATLDEEDTHDRQTVRNNASSFPSRPSAKNPARLLFFRKFSQ